MAGQSIYRIVMVVTAMLYAVRPYVCGRVLESYAVLGDAPYAAFDRHGISAGLGMVGAVALAWPVLRLARALFRPDPAAGVAGVPVSARMAVASGAVAVAIGAPSFVQLDYMLALPLDVMWPVVVSATGWAMLVAILWLACIGSAERRAAMVALRHRGAGVAVLMTLPKLMLLGS